jgi:hypothetical protein
MEEENPYELQPIQAELGDITSAKAEIEKAKEEDLIGLSWNEWIECVQWLSTRFTKGDDAPSEWDDSYIRAMYQDLQYYSFKNVQQAIVKLHGEGRSYAPNSSQIIGMLNKLGARTATSYTTYNMLKQGKTECSAGGTHVWTDWGWMFDETGEPYFMEYCPKTAGPELPSCNAERKKEDVLLSDYNKRTKPKPMTRELFISTMKKMKLNEDLQNELLEFKSRLRSEKEVKNEV